jgi:hypothetical protein
MEPYLIVAGNADEPLDRFVAAAPTGRYLVFVVKGRLFLLDTHSHRRVDLSALGAKSSDDGHPLGPDPVASFDTEGNRLLYLRPTKTGPRAVLRELATDAETLVDHGEGVLWRASLAGSGFVWAWVRPSSGRMRLPQTTLAGRNCRGPIASYSTFGVGGEGPIRRLIHLRGGPPVNEDGLIGLAGSAVLRRLDDGAIVWEHGGRARPVVPANCGGAVLAFWGEAGSVLVACTMMGKPSPVYWYGPTTRALDLKLDEPDPEPLRTRIWVEWQGGRSHVVDLQTGAHKMVPNEAVEVATHGDKTYLHRAEHKGFHAEWNAFIDWRTGIVTPMPAAFPRYPHAVIGGSWAALQPGERPGPVIEMSSGKIVGSVDRDPLAMTPGGWVLLETPKDGRLRLIGPPYQGPLHWERPGPVVGSGK